MRAGVERMAHVANADDDGLLGGARLDHVAAGATDFRVHIFRMNVRLHKKDGKTITILPDDKREFQVETKCNFNKIDVDFNFVELYKTKEQFNFIK